MTRGFAALGVAILIMLAMIADAYTSRPIDPFQSPPLFALGSGQAPIGALCTTLPE